MSENNSNGFNNQNPNNMNMQNNFNNNQYQTNTNNQNDYYSNGYNATGQNDFNNQYQNNMNGQNDFNNQYQNNMNVQNAFNNQYQNNSNNFNNQFQNSAADFTSCFDPMDIENNKVLSAISYFGILFFIPLVAAPNSRFAKFHANQSLVLLIASVIVKIISGVFTFFYNILPWSLYKMLKWIPSLLGLAIFVAFVYGFINAISGKAKEIPVIGSIKLIKF